MKASRKTTHVGFIMVMMISVSMPLMAKDMPRNPPGKQPPLGPTEKPPGLDFPWNPNPPPWKPVGPGKLPDQNEAPGQMPVPDYHFSPPNIGNGFSGPPQFIPAPRLAPPVFNLRPTLAPPVFNLRPTLAPPVFNLRPMLMPFLPPPIPR
jgi:hypothetical protein